MPASSDREPTLSHIFVLRLWREQADAPWRAALRSAAEAAPIGFADLEQLAAFLLRLADGDGAAVGTRHGTVLPPEADVSESTTSHTGDPG